MMQPVVELLDLLLCALCERSGRSVKFGPFLGQSPRQRLFRVRKNIQHDSFAAMPIQRHLQDRGSAESLMRKQNVLPKTLAAVRNDRVERYSRQLPKQT